MVRNYIKSTQQQSKTYTDSELKRAIQLVNDGEPCKRVARLLNIPHRTLRCHISGLRKSSVVGRKSSLQPDEEMSIAQYIAIFSDFGYAFDKIDLKLFVQSFLNKSGRNCPFFNENLPGDDWVRSFLERHKSVLSYRACQNICRRRAAISCDSVNRFFNNLEDTIKNIQPQNIINYDETNLSDDPKSKQMIFRKGTKHAERVINTSKSSVSIMFACTADGIFLPPYTVYKAERLMDTWILGGPIGARYNRTKSGWFDGNCFKDWMQTLVVPYFRHVDNNTPKLLIGDNLACHLSIDVIEICETNNIRMVFLPPNSTHLLQPLDLAVYGPMKSTWRKIITEYGKWVKEDFIHLYQKMFFQDCSLIS
ncbi:jerky protein homolog-like [Hydra vulgaris]|uniref:Jerky protein homolog-like n=1 Tax=Hydra vulgaris TaxID=6087 RepID=A0ABM4B1J4_HYDVU